MRHDKSFRFINIDRSRKVTFFVHLFSTTSTEIPSFLLVLDGLRGRLEAGRLTAFTCNGLECMTKCQAMHLDLQVFLFLKHRRRAGQLFGFGHRVVFPPMRPTLTFLGYHNGLRLSSRKRAGPGRGGAVQRFAAWHSHSWRCSKDDGDRGGENLQTPGTATLGGAAQARVPVPRRAGWGTSSMQGRPGNGPRSYARKIPQARLCHCR